MKAILLFLLTSSSCFASYIVNDPSNLLNTVDTYLNAQDFDQAFKLNDLVRFETRKCESTQNEDGSYSGSCEAPEVHEDYVSDKTPDLTIIKPVGGTDSVTITRQEHESINGNHLRFYLENIRSYTGLSSVEINLEKIEFESINISESTVQAVRVFYLVKLCKNDPQNQTECFITPEEMLLGRNLPALGQVIEHIPNRKVLGKSRIYKLLEVSRL